MQQIKVIRNDYGNRQNDLKVQTDIDYIPYNLVNTFCTDDNFYISYRIGVKTAEFVSPIYYLVQLEKYSGYYKIVKLEKLIRSFKTAQEKIEELIKNKN